MNIEEFKKQCSKQKLENENAHSLMIRTWEETFSEQASYGIAFQPDGGKCPHCGKCLLRSGHYTVPYHVHYILECTCGYKFARSEMLPW